jgi:2,3-bisphosphoglycerate-independent phosphoglycerate mutase
LKNETKKHIIVIPDGAADEPLEIFDGKTVIEAAATPNIDRLCRSGYQGMARTVPEGTAPGSDVAQMSILGYNVLENYNGRAPIEAAAQGIRLGSEDWVFRCNLVTYADECMADHSAGHISNEEASKLMDVIESELGTENIKFYKGVSYRHLCVISGVAFDLETQPPHEIIGKPIDKNLPKGKNESVIRELMLRSRSLFEDHEINTVRMDLGENPVSSIWLWGQGRKTELKPFKDLYGKTGAMITAVDLARGLATLIGFDIINVEGATGYYDTNYHGKTAAAKEALKTHDVVIVHIEGPDEAGHSGNAIIKKKALERIDELVIGPLAEEMEKYPGSRMLVMPDHPTPVRTQGHTADPVPFLIYGNGIKPNVDKTFSEKNAAESGLFIDEGYQLMEFFLKA